jgi:hypothetical protein
MLEGDQAAALELIQRFTESPGRWGSPLAFSEGHYRLLQNTRQIQRFFEAHARPWNGEEWEILGIERPKTEKAAGLGHRSARGSAKGSSIRTLSNRVARARAHMIGIGPRWDGPALAGGICPTCRAELARLDYCLRCDGAAFRLDDDRVGQADPAAM